MKIFELDFDTKSFKFLLVVVEAVFEMAYLAMQQQHVARLNDPFMLIMFFNLNMFFKQKLAAEWLLRDTLLL